MEEPRTKKRPWTDDEDERLAAAVQATGERNWKAKAAAVGTRDHVQCLQRWSNVLKPKLTVGTWTVQDDTKLANLVADYQSRSVEPSWSKIARKLKKANARDCRERWQFHLQRQVDVPRPLPVFHAPFTYWGYADYPPRPPDYYDYYARRSWPSPSSSSQSPDDSPTEA